MDIIDQTVERIVKLGFDPMSAPYSHKVAVMLTTAQGLLDNGGFEYLLGNPFNQKTELRDFVSAFAAVGATACAEAFAEALARSAAANPDYRDLDKLLWSQSERNYDLLKTYIEQHAQDFA